MSITVACVIVLVGLEDVYLHRFSQLKQAVSSGLVEAYRSVGNVASSTDVNKTGINDVNVTSRLEEYAIAWHKFISSPVLGQGLGIKDRKSTRLNSSN